MANFPTSLPAATPTADDVNDSDDDLAGTGGSGFNHATEHGRLTGEVLAVATKVGVDSSAVATSHDYKIAALEAGTPLATIPGYTAMILSDPGRSRASSAAELTFLTNALYDIPADSLVAGDVFRWECDGTLTHTEGSARTFTLKLKLDAVALMTIVPANIANGVTSKWTHSGFFRMHAIGTAGVALVLGACTTRLANHGANTTLQELTHTVFSIAVDTTQALTIDFTNQNSVSSANFTNACSDFVMWKSNAP